jgi:hypothetical protein
MAHAAPQQSGAVRHAATGGRVGRMGGEARNAARAQVAAAGTWPRLGSGRERDVATQQRGFSHGSRSHRSLSRRAARVRARRRDGDVSTAARAYDDPE